FTPELANAKGVSQTLVEHAKNDWDASELSWDFSSCRLLELEQSELSTAYSRFIRRSEALINDVLKRESENNRTVIEQFNLQDEIPAVTGKELVTLNCNASYRYGLGKSETELEALFLADTMRELISYAVGCMWGRYSLDKPGLIL